MQGFQIFPCMVFDVRVCYFAKTRANSAILATGPIMFPKRINNTRTSNIAKVNPRNSRLPNCLRVRRGMPIIKNKNIYSHFRPVQPPNLRLPIFFGGQIFWAWSQLLQRLTCFPGSLIQDGFVSFSSVFYCHTLISLPSEADPDPERCWMTLEPISLPGQRQLPVQRGRKHSPRDRRRRQHSMRLQSTSFHFQIWRWLWDCNRPVAEREGQILFLFLFS